MCVKHRFFVLLKAISIKVALFFCQSAKPLVLVWLPHVYHPTDHSCMFKYEFILRSLSLLLGGFGARAQELSKNRISKSIQRVLQSTNTSTPMVLELLYTKTPFERLHADTHTHTYTKIHRYTIGTYGHWANEKEKSYENSHKTHTHHTFWYLFSYRTKNRIYQNRRVYFVFSVPFWCVFQATVSWKENRKPPKKKLEENSLKVSAQQFFGLIQSNREKRETQTGKKSIEIFRFAAKNSTRRKSVGLHFYCVRSFRRFFFFLIVHNEWVSF